MNKFRRLMLQPVEYIGRGGKRVTACREHQNLAKAAATEGTVLLKNDGVLPLKKGSRVCLFGRGAGDLLFGGGGSGEVTAKHNTDLSEGLEKLGETEQFTPLSAFYREQAEKEYADLHARYPIPRDFKFYLRSHAKKEFVLPDALYQKAVAFGGTAVFVLSRYSGETFDRTPQEGGFSLSEEERDLLDRLCRDFENVVAVLNVCGVVETSFFAENARIGAVLFPLFGGMCAGESIAEILTGKAYPSGHLQDTLAVSVTDYPSDSGFFESEEYVNYEEDIFVGYRYFETFCKDRVVYPFGFGLSYTSFEWQTLSAKMENKRVEISVSVKNTGGFAGKEVMQAYLSAPQGLLGKPARELCAFCKTKELKPGESQRITLSFQINQFASFDDLGKIEKSAFVLEKGMYRVFIGQNVRDAEEVFGFDLPDNQVVKKSRSYMSPRALPRRLLANGSYETLPTAKNEVRPVKTLSLKEERPKETLSLSQALEEKRLHAFMAQLSDAEIAALLYGHVTANVSHTGSIGLIPYPQDLRQIPLVPTADGPAGLHIRKKNEMHTTYFPCANAVAQSWNLKLCERIGKAGAREIKENNIGIWLTPALNIHRSPHCGRNFEYYSEDPLAAGYFAAACVKGIQSQRIAATIKHFCCNNKEGNRRNSDSRVSERALREIYLKGFEIVVKKAHPWALMSSYNLVNGVRSSANPDALNGILRNEWHFDGVVMTDWDVYSYLHEEISAGGDVKMPVLLPTTAKPDEKYDFAEMLGTNPTLRGAALLSVERIFKMMEHLE